MTLRLTNQMSLYAPTLRTENGYQVANATIQAPSYIFFQAPGIGVDPPLPEAYFRRNTVPAVPI